MVIGNKELIMESIIIEHFSYMKEQYINELLLYVIYYNPLDFKDKYVARLWRIKKGIIQPTSYCTVKETLDECRETLPYGLNKIPRHIKDDPVLVESWV
jgi:hypothetical protein